MMKYILLITTFFLLSANIVSADYQSARQAYQMSFSTYRDLLPKYLSARSEYLTYKTLVSRTRAVTESQLFLQARQEVSINYLNMLEQKLQVNETPYLDSVQTQVLLIEIAKLRDSFNKQIPLINNISTIEQITEVSAQTDSYLNSMEIIGYKAQALSIDSRIKEYHENSLNFQNSTSEQVRRIAVESQIPTEKFERWLLDAQQKNDLSLNSYNKANIQISKINNINSYAKLQIEYVNAKQYTKESLRYLLEILRNLKIKQ